MDKNIDIVSNFEASKRLKELGLKQDSRFYYLKEKSNEADYWELFVKINSRYYPIEDSNLDDARYGFDEKYVDVISAFTVNEMFTLLPKTIKADGIEYGTLNLYPRCFYDGTFVLFYASYDEMGCVVHKVGDLSHNNRTLSEATADLLIYVAENDLWI